MIDPDGFRPNVGIFLINHEARVFWARRIGNNSWQCPQGGVDPNESAEDALVREVYEEIGLEAADYKILGCTRKWLRYRLPEHLLRRRSKPLCIGQKQKWFLIQLESPAQKIQLNLNDTPEFDSWRWVDYWYPPNHVIEFKQEVYQKALRELMQYCPVHPGVPC